MQIDDRWNDLSDADWNRFASAWLDELNDREPSDLPDLPILIEDEEQDAGDFVIQMNFTGSDQSQWKFILSAFAAASDDDLGHIAAGPIEHLLWKHGSVYIDEIESMSSNDLRFGKMMTGVYRHGIHDDIWERVQQLQAKFE